PGYVGGAELTQDEFAKAAPEGVEIVHCPSGHVDPDCDRYAIHNCVLYSAEDLKAIEGKPTVKYWNDVVSWVKAEVRQLLDQHARPIGGPPVQAEYRGLADVVLIPPPVDLARFERAAEAINGRRRGVVSVGSWQGIGKGPHWAAQWARSHDADIDFYGGGPF